MSVRELLVSRVVVRQRLLSRAKDAAGTAPAEIDQLTLDLLDAELELAKYDEEKG